jgi:hypothetical protein
MEQINGKWYFSDDNIKTMKKVALTLKDKFGAKDVELRRPVQIRNMSDYKLFLLGCTKYPRESELNYEIDELKEIFGSKEIAIFKSPFQEDTVMISIYNVQLTTNTLEGGK